MRLTWADINTEQKLVTFRATKNGSDRTIPMTTRLRATLAAMPRPRDPATPVLSKIAPLVLTRSFARLVERLGLRDLTFHDLRHTWPRPWP